MDKKAQLKHFITYKTVCYDEWISNLNSSTKPGVEVPLMAGEIQFLNIIDKIGYIRTNKSDSFKLTCGYRNPSFQASDF